MNRYALLSQVWPVDSQVPVSGSSVQVYHVGQELARRGRPTLVTLSAHPGFANVQEGNLKVVSLPPPGRGLTGMLFTSWMKDMFNVLEDFQPSVVYQRGKLPESVVAARYAQRTDAKFVWLSNSNNTGQRWKFVRKRMAKKGRHLRFLPLLVDAFIGDVIIEQAIKRADVVIAQTERQKETIKKSFGQNSILLGSGHEIPEFRQKNNRIPKVLWLANLTPVKQPQLFAKLANSLKDENSRFIMAGRADNEPLLSQVKKHVRGLNNFSYVGGVSLAEANALFDEADLFVCTSWPGAEGLPNTFIQACVHGVPIISLGNDPDSMIEKHGIGAAVDSFDELVRTVRLWIKDGRLRSRAGDTAYSYAQRHLGIDQVVDKLEEAIVRPTK